MKEAYRKDFELVQKVLKGYRYAFEEIVKKYELQVAKTVIGMLGNTVEAEDVGQEVFIRFYRSMHKYNGDSSLGTYLTRIAINLSLNELKRNSNKTYNNIDRQEYRLYTEDEFERKDTKEIVNRALQQLEPDYRSVVILRMIDGYSTKETAEILKLPVGTVLSRLSRAQSKLKEIISATTVNKK
jgi:RNA polymerase sigma-70 factor (ECF subfamily)